MMNMTACPVSTTAAAVDFQFKRIIVSKRFMAASRKVGSPEFLMMMQLANEMPQFSIEVKQTRSRHRKMFQPTYSFMNDYIAMQPDHDEAMEEFFMIRRMSRNYNQVRSWFIRKYPEAEATFNGTGFSMAA